MSSSQPLEVDLHWLRLSPPPLPPERHLLLLVGVPGRERLEDLQLGAVPHQPLGRHDAQALAPDLHHLQAREFVLLEDSPEQRVTDVGGSVVRSEWIFESQLLDVRAERQEDQEAAHPEVLEVKLLQLLEIVVLVHHCQHGALELGQPLLKTGNLRRNVF